MLGFASVGRQPSSRSSFAARSIRFSISRTDSRYSSSFLRSPVLIFGCRSCVSCKHRVQDAAVQFASLAVAHQLVEDARRVDLLGRRLGGRRPGNAGPVQHGEPVFQPQFVRLDAQRQAGHRRAIADLRAPSPGPSTFPRGWSLGSRLTGAPESMFIRPRCGLGRGKRGLVVQAADEDQVFADGRQRQPPPGRTPSPRLRPSPTSARGRPRWKSRCTRSAAEADWRAALRTQELAATPSKAAPAPRPRRAGNDAAISVDRSSSPRPSRATDYLHLPGPTGCGTACW